jgi:diadenosine tetraphosphatase ApaH/serine/threonine PP2A family protein phosphatase
MIIGIFSDVHSNLEAMKKVRESYENLDLDIEKYICLGDVVGYGADPNACSEIVREMAETTILGNHDAAVCGRMNYAFYYDAARNALDWHADQLEDTHHDWLRELDYYEHWEDIEYCHGSPVNREDFEYVFNIHQANQLIEHWDDIQHITFIGHSHLTKAFELDQDTGAVELTGPTLDFDEGKKYVVTVGSVGQPRDNDNRACYGTYDHEAKTFTYHRVEYDVRKAARKIFESELSSDFAKRLFFGI